MSTSDTLTQEEYATLLALLTKLTSASGDDQPVPDEVATALSGAALLAYSSATDHGARAVDVLPAGLEPTATDVVVLVSALLHAAGLNSFDLAMWFRRPG